MRIVILGPGAAGKSTFPRRLGEATGVQPVELDRVFWSDETHLRMFMNPLAEVDRNPLDLK